MTNLAKQFIDSPLMSSNIEGKRIAITGGCGFIGSHIVDLVALCNPEKIIVIDDLSAGTTTTFLEPYLETGLIEFHQKDIRDKVAMELLLSSTPVVFHLAAQPSVPFSVNNPYEDFMINVVGTQNVLEALRVHEDSLLVFTASGGTIYGEAEIIPTDEKYRLEPISNYGAAKAASEMYLSSYSSLYNLRTISLRLGNIYGPRSSHGVMYDFYNKLKRTPDSLEILGNGQQKKSYLYIGDVLSAVDLLVSKELVGFNAFNVASPYSTSVDEIADIILDSLSLTSEKKYTGGTRGWKGDVIHAESDIQKLVSLGWEVKTTIIEGINAYIASLSES
ncbi:MAG: GDP-mannose 4,6-dehydratase [Candidatus Kariarchaeaceae archaeon]